MEQRQQGARNGGVCFSGEDDFQTAVEDTMAITFFRIFFGVDAVADPGLQFVGRGLEA